jgi:hypothetical protein
MTPLDTLRPPGGWTAPVAKPVEEGEPNPPTEHGRTLTLVAQCFDCGGALDVVRSNRHNGGLYLRSIVQCTDCGRRWTVEVTLVGHPKPAPREPGDRS